MILHHEYFYYILLEVYFHTFEVFTLKNHPKANQVLKVLLFT